MKGTRAKRNVCPGSCVSTGAKFPVAPVESAPMFGAFERGNVRTCTISITIDSKHTAIVGLQIVKLFNVSVKRVRNLMSLSQLRSGGTFQYFLRDSCNECWNNPQ